jgi:peptidoglycan/xylan/chitin deacetylase (PgdA/CDA1 family)
MENPRGEAIDVSVAPMILDRRNFGRLALAASLTPLIARAAAPVRKLAITFDDLPYAAEPFAEDLAAATRVTESLTSALVDYDAPSVGFVNEGRVDVPGERDARMSLLRSWINAGTQLGNHTYSHGDLNRLNIEDFLEDVVRGEASLMELAGTGSSANKYFRFPYNHTGPTEQIKQDMEAFLLERGYRIAPHTIDTSDYPFNLPYLDCVRRNDRATSDTIKGAYLDHSMAATDFAEYVAPRLFGYDIPHILLLHANNINADCLPELLMLYRARGYRFVSLDDAMDDPAYATPDTQVTTFGPTWLWRWNMSLGLNISFRDDPDAPEWISEQFAALIRATNNSDGQTQ